MIAVDLRVVWMVLNVYKEKDVMQVSVALHAPLMNNVLTTKFARVDCVSLVVNPTLTVPANWRVFPDSV